ncbi:MAG TPA: ATP-grasp domain-containing protein [Bacteroidetes bacterium]|nr:ATP-grasp domain-containing protein [Bacteroidota bacterium]
MKKVLILVNDPGKEASPDVQDVLMQAGAVENVLREMDAEVKRFSVSLNLEALDSLLQKDPPDLVFNLVESLAGRGALLHLVPALLEVRYIPFTGSGSYGLYLTTHKVRAKRIMRQHGIHTPDWISLPADTFPEKGKRYIMKPVSEDGSAGIHDASLVQAGELTREILSGSTTPAYFLEEYLPGREFNLSVIAGPEGPQVLPAAEMQYLDYPADKPRILGYAAKWEENSFEYRHTVRRFEMAETDRVLVREMERISLQCWHLFEARGYIRVDFRTDAEGNPCVIEVNANPCISPDAGFPAACLHAGIGYREMILRILNDLTV